MRRLEAAVLWTNSLGTYDVQLENKILSLLYQLTPIPETRCDVCLDDTKTSWTHCETKLFNPTVT